MYFICVNLQPGTYKRLTNVSRDAVSKVKKKTLILCDKYSLRHVAKVFPTEIT